ncbi:dolichyl-phosphate beta-glucosyltransferase [Methylacidiphilum caldifontis]|uniref:dolichyl-phosphate beta-glucosyltransferase n=1 Tax=Methylacidiphilum caldifontis TaxID=2795386 RepID=A0A4Y8PCE4_9BACT|nr:dolichyl-phosphate beta-glucosyltransferase [Methylacidiphilum caldifontis]QSR87906.1 glycosyltransferase family 2 protein [Methylacidiphilum caldifontis]TFE68907.1 glycosyl transferase [Methylacidiphilum caldifontis]
MTLFSVVLPVYNEEKVIQAVSQSICRFAQEHPQYEFVFVNDGSTDNTGMLLKTSLNEFRTKQVQLIDYKTNRGKGFAIREGFKHTTGDHFCFLDGDLAYPLDYLPQFEEKLQNCDIAIGSRVSEKKGKSWDRSLRRKVLGFCFNKLVSSILGLPYSDTQAGLKAFRRDVAERLFKMQKIEGFSFDVELIFLARKLGYKIVEIPVKVSPTHSYKHSKIKLFGDSLRMLKELLQIKHFDSIGEYDRQNLP